MNKIEKILKLAALYEEASKAQKLYFLRKHAALPLAPLAIGALKFISIGVLLTLTGSGIHALNEQRYKYNSLS